ncbi:MAG: hypothetical protein ACJ8FY_26830 [Gemmataceae bacterium]
MFENKQLDVTEEAVRGLRFLDLGERLLAKAKQISHRAENRISRLYEDGRTEQFDDRPTEIDEQEIARSTCETN